jgi:hypothetical protein
METMETMGMRVSRLTRRRGDAERDAEKTAGQIADLLGFTMF